MLGKLRNLKAKTKEQLNGEMKINHCCCYELEESTNLGQFKEGY